MTRLVRPDRENEIEHRSFVVEAPIVLCDLRDGRRSRSPLGDVASLDLVGDLGVGYALRIARRLA